MGRYKKKGTDPYTCNISLSFIVDAADKKAAKEHIKELERNIRYTLVKCEHERNIKSVSYVDDLDYDQGHNTYHQAKRNNKRAANKLLMFIEQAYKWNPWDYSHTIDLFIKLLHKHALDLKKDVWHINSYKYYKRCLYAANMLDKLYNKNTITSDPAYKYYSNKYTVFYETELIEKLSKFAANRYNKQDAQRKQDIWTFIAKHIERWWS